MLIVQNEGTAESGNRPRRLGLLRNSVWWDARLAAFRAGEDGTVTGFSLFIFLMMLFVGGMAVDLMRFETERSALQNTLDAASLAATNLRSTSDPEELVVAFLEKRGYDPDLASVVVTEARSGANAATGETGTLAARSVSATYDLTVNTFFMPFLGIDTLGTAARGAAKEGLQSVEISLVLDISTSMSWDGKLDDLKTSAKKFVDDVIDPDRDDSPVTISIVPFNHTVRVPESLLARLNTEGEIEIPVGDRAEYGGALTRYDRTSTNSKCVRFMDDELMTSSLASDYLFLRAITTTQELDRVASYYSHVYRTEWCRDSMPEILLYETDASDLEAYINDLSAWGATSNDTGLKWGAALLDPAFRDLVSDMITDGELPSAISGRPYDYDPTNFMKVLVLMTDGANTEQFDLADEMKNGPSRVWYSETAESETGDGYFVEMPGNSEDLRFLRPGKLSSTDWWDTSWQSDGELVSAEQMEAYGDTDGDGDGDVVQLSYTQLYSSAHFPSTRNVARLFYDSNYGDYDAYSAHLNGNVAVIDNEADGQADRRMSGSPKNSSTDYGLCDAIKVNNDILVFTIAFQAGDDAEAVMADCATSSNYYFDADDGDALDAAFETIAGTITKLRLTQ